MRILWGRATSSNVMKVIWLLEELELPYERRDVGGPFGQTDTPAYRAMNPTGLVPTLQEDAFALPESNAIMRYLVNAYAPGDSRFPEDPQPRATIDRWMEWQQTTLNRPQAVVFQGLIRIAPEKRDHAAINAAIVEVGRAWSTLDERLSRRPYVCSDDFSLADIAIGVHVHRWFAFDIERPETPHLRAWYQRLLERPVYVEHVARPLV